MTTQSAVTPLTHRAEMLGAEERVLAALDQSEDWARQSSGLPGWSRAHVVAHLGANAAGMRRLVRWAATGDQTPMYPSREARAAEIEERSSLPLAQLRDELKSESELLVGDLDALSYPLGATSLVLGSGAQFDAWELPMLRTREVEIHHVDLGSDYTPDDWQEPFTFRTMNQVVPTFIARGNLPGSALIATDTGRVWAPGHRGLPEQEVGADDSEIVGLQGQLLAWLLGRPHHGVTCRDGTPAPPAPRWA